jgi:hypothetical protein
MENTSFLSISSRARFCLRCNTRMLVSSHYEEEHIGTLVVVSEVSLAECPNCSTSIKITFPTTYLEIT